MTLHIADLPVAVDLWRAMADATEEEGWSLPAGGLEWTCLRTLDHTAGALLSYSGSLAARATDRQPRLRDGGSEGVAGTVEVLAAAAAVLGDVVRAAPAEARGWHSSGMADAEGFIGMALAEMLVHGDDVAAGLGVAWSPPAELCGRLRDRLFPWAPTGLDEWQTVRWACGRTALPDHPQLAPDWYWHSPPLAEWDGTRTLRV